MADTVTLTTIENTKKRLVIEASIQSDGTGSTDAILVDKSTFTGLNGAEPGRLVVERIDYQCDGMQIVLEFDHTTDDLIATLAGQGFIDFTKGNRFQGFIDPASAGTTGDIVATTVGHTAGDKATIRLQLRKKD